MGVDDEYWKWTF
jgi:hypothetical protein